MRLTTALLGAAAALATNALAASVCNGDASLCSRLYSNVTYIGAHDSYAVGSSIADNQDKDVTGQLVSEVVVGGSAVWWWLPRVWFPGNAWLR